MKVKIENVMSLNPFDWKVKFSGKSKKDVDDAIEQRYNEIPPARFPEKTDVFFDGKQFVGYLSFAKNV